MLFRIFLIILFASLNKAFAYPNFIGKGYHNCLTCHYNPFGNGPLNDYGRGVAASGLAGRLLIPKSVSDEKLSNISGFFFNKQDKQFLKPSLDYRGGNIYSDLQAEESEDKWINMQMDISISAVFGKRKEYVTTYTHSIVPSNSIPSGKAEYEVEAGEDLTYSREHYIGYKHTNTLAFYLGKMDKVFGIRVPDHTAYSRYTTGNNQYGAVHGAMVHHYKENYDLGFQIYLGDMEKTEDYQYQGFTTKFEYSVNDKFRPGISYMSESNDLTEKTAYSASAKVRVGKGSSIMAEMGRVTDTPEGLDPTTQQFIFLQNHFYLTRGLYFVTTYENLNTDITNDDETHRFAPGVLYFPLQRVEIRADLYTSKTYAEGVTTKDTWQFLGQVHIWF